MRKTTNYENILFQDEFDKQLDPTDASWVLNFVGNNFTLFDFCDMDELIEYMVEASRDRCNEFLVFRNDEEFFTYAKEQYYPEKFFTKEQLEEALERLEGK